MESEREQVNRYFTQAVVGRPVRMNLGVATRPPNGLRWGPVGKPQARKGLWMPSAWRMPSLEDIKAALHSRTGRVIGIGTSVLVIVVLIAVGTTAITNRSAGQEDVAVVEVKPSPPVTLSSIQLERAEFPQEQGPSSLDAAPNRPAEGPLPMFAPPGEKAAAPFKLKPNLQPTDVAGAKVPEKQGAQGEKGKPVSAVILDAAPEKAKSNQVTAQTEPKTTSRIPDPQVKQVGPVTLRPAGASPAQSGPTVTIVDIDRNGSFVLLTNPVSRLPEKFVAGQKIFTGETITKIDPANGRIQLGNRTVNMN